MLAWVLFGACFGIGSMLESSGVRGGAVVRGGDDVVRRVAIVEWWFGQPVETSAVTSRLGGPFGSAAYLGALVSADSRSRWSCRRPVGADWLAGSRCGGDVMATIALVGAGSRAAWIGLFVPAFVAAVMIRPGWRFVLVAIGTVAACVVVMRRSPRRRARSFGADHLLLDEWAMARVVADHPVVGVGPEGYRTALADGVTADYERTYGRRAARSGPQRTARPRRCGGGCRRRCLYVRSRRRRRRGGCPADAIGRADGWAGGGGGCLPRAAGAAVPDRRARPDPVAGGGRLLATYASQRRRAPSRGREWVLRSPVW